MYRIILLISLLFVSFNSYADENDLITDTEVMMIEPNDWFSTKYNKLSEMEKLSALSDNAQCPNVYSIKIGKPINYSYYNDKENIIVMLSFSEYQRFIRLINNAVYYDNMFTFLSKHYHCSNYSFFDVPRNTIYRLRMSKLLLTTDFKMNFPTFEYVYNINNANYVFFKFQNNNDFNNFVKYVEFVYNIVRYSSNSFYKYNKAVLKYNKSIEKYR